MTMLTSVFRRVASLLGRGHRGSTGATARILIVDDDAPVRRFVDRVLREAGYQTTVASDGPEALGVATITGPPDLLLTDVRMPGMNGDELARRLRAQEPDLRVLYLTGYSDQLFTERMVLWEKEAFLEKPCSVQALLEAVSLMLSGHTAIRRDRPADGGSPPPIDKASG